MTAEESVQRASDALRQASGGLEDANSTLGGAFGRPILGTRRGERAHSRRTTPDGGPRPSIRCCACGKRRPWGAAFLTNKAGADAWTPAGVEDDDGDLAGFEQLIQAVRGVRGTWLATRARAHISLAAPAHPCAPSGSVCAGHNALASARSGDLNDAERRRAATSMMLQLMQQFGLDDEEDDEDDADAQGTR